MPTPSDLLIVGYDEPIPAPEKSKQDQLWRRANVLTRGAVANGCGRFLASTVSYAAAGTARLAMYAVVACTDLQVHFSGFRQSSGAIASDPTFTVKVSLQMADGAGAPTGVAIPIYFSGVRTATVNTGTIVASDPLPIPLAAGTKFFLAVYCTGTGYSNRTIHGSLSDGEGWVATTDASDTLTGFGNSNNAMIIAPFMVSGTVNQADKIGVALLGDGNVEAYLFDSLQSGSISPGRQGWMERGFARYAPTVNLSGAGISAATVANPQLSVPLLYCLSYCRDAAMQLGFWDLSGSTVAQIQANLLSITNQIRNAGIRKVFSSTLTPYTSATASGSGDWWFTLANQASSGNEAKRVSINRWLRAVPYQFDGVIDPCQYVESSQDSGLWNPGFLSVSTTFGTVSAGNQWQIVGGNVDTQGQFVLYGTEARYIQRYNFPIFYAATAFTVTPTAGQSLGLYQTFTVDGISMGSWGHLQAAQAITPDLLA